MTESTLIAYLHPGTVSHSFHESLMSMCMSTRGIAGTMALFTGAGDLVSNRNAATARFLDETDYSHLLFVDTDMGFPADALSRLLAVNQPIVGALTFSAKANAPDGLGGFRIEIEPVMFRAGQNEAGEWGFIRRPDYAPDTVTRVGATGAAFLLLERDALKALGPDPWTPVRGMGEDLSLCARALDADIPIFVHTGVKTSHHKQIWVSEADHAVRHSGRDQDVPGHRER